MVWKGNGERKSTGAVKNSFGVLPCDPVKGYVAAPAQGRITGLVLRAYLGPVCPQGWTGICLLVTTRPNRIAQSG